MVAADIIPVGPSALAPPLPPDLLAEPLRRKPDVAAVYLKLSLFLCATVVVSVLLSTSAVVLSFACSLIIC